MNDVYLLMGGNLGNRLSALQQAATALHSLAGNITAESNIYETAAWGLTDQPNFLNKVLQLSTPLLPAAILQLALQIEEEMGRKRTIKFGPRLIDIDILFYNNDIINTAALTVPHPEIQNRLFALRPMVDIAPNLVHPILNKTMLQLLAACTDQLDVQLYKM